MAKILIKGGKRLHGEVTICGAKNSTVALIPASILASTPVRFDMVPDILDVYNLQLILKSMNVSSDFHDGFLEIDPTKIIKAPLPKNAIKSLRASYYFMGALLGRFGEAIVTFPGGDNIGPRPIEQHIKGFKALGASVHEENDTIYITTGSEGLHGAEIFFDKVSVGATMNLIMASVKAKGLTILENVAREPEIIDLATFLNNMGANIRGAGTDTIRISGVPILRSSATHTIIPDRIEAGTYITAAAAMGDGVTVKNVIPEHLESFTSKLIEMGVHLRISEDEIFVPATHRLSPVTITTAPFPGFATDLQQPISPLLMKADGLSTIIDTIYPQRIRHVVELRRMGGDISSLEGGVIQINSSPRLVGTEVQAAEIRAGAALVVAGLMADGQTTITHAEHILRGYEKIQDKLNGLGADVEVENANMPTTAS
ncbi:UDP-N-acetylglucosamine 1-carboxyvinyltransferase [Oenococcus alcoholitolerans]|uniref:UDP-N-acetylglucosamine 1-carboxyvinyltransferase n=1 Tax=Oenococcus alcoholitolerans TaxID=931074 RepID=UPI003F70332D